jgi:hypothetical protein
MRQLQDANEAYLRMVEAGGTLFQALLPPTDDSRPQLPGAELDDERGRCPEPVREPVAGVDPPAPPRQDGEAKPPPPRATPHHERRKQALVGLEHETRGHESEPCK